MNQNLNDNERSRLGNTNLDAFFSHLNFLVDNPEQLASIPNDSTVIYQGTGDAWVNAQNDILAEQAIANGEKVHRVIVPGRFCLTFPDGRKVNVYSHPYNISSRGIIKTLVCYNLQIEKTSYLEAFSSL